MHVCIHELNTLYDASNIMYVPVITLHKPALFVSGTIKRHNYIPTYYGRVISMISPHVCTRGQHEYGVCILQLASIFTYGHTKKTFGRVVHTIRVVPPPLPACICGQGWPDFL